MQHLAHRPESSGSHPPLPHRLVRCVCVCACVRVRTYVHMHVCVVCVCVCACGVCGVYENVCASQQQLATHAQSTHTLYERS